MDVAALNWLVLIPAAVVSLGAMGVLLLEVLLSPGGSEQRPGDAAAERRLGLLLALISSAALLIALIASTSFLVDGTQLRFDPSRPMLGLDGFSSAMMAIVAAGALLAVWLSSTYLMALDIDHGEYYALLLLAVAGMFVALCSETLLMLYMGIELMSIPVYVLAAFDRSKLRSNEAGLKYFLMGAFASAILLYGMALLYGATGRLDYTGLALQLDPSSSIALAGIALVVVGLGFKLALAPFHQWAPDVYEGAPTPVTAFMSVCVKATAAAVLVRVIVRALPDAPELDELMRPLLWGLAALSIGVGNLMAIIQPNVKRMLAYSGIAHMGYLMLALVADTPASYAALLYYLLVYVFANLGAFGVVIAFATRGREFERIEDYAGIARDHPALALAMTLFMLALAGIPGTAGFWAKFHLFTASVGAGDVPLVIVAVLGSVVSVFYYLKIPIAMYMRDTLESEPIRPSTSELAVLLICAAVVLQLGLFPNTRLPGQALGVLDLLRSTVGS